MKGIEKQKLLQSIALFAFAYKGNTDHLDFEDNDAGIEIENLAFSLAEDMGFDINAHESFLSRATVLERCRLMLKELVLLLEPEFAEQDRLYISIIDCSESNLAEYLFNHEERVEDLKLEIWTESTMNTESLSAISSLNLFEGVLTSEQQSFSVFRIK
ncbi:hypothetical protein [Vibrio chagasii]|uniref:hypothetical protein n=1 Tax=Vibrio chagasii TaxID=170679 RepID=UPI003BB562AD